MSRDTQVLPFISSRAGGPSETEILRPASALLAGNSRAASQLRAQLRRVAPYYRTVALCGEPGSGEAAVARTLHALSPLHDLPLTELSAAAAEKYFARGPVAVGGASSGTLYLPETAKLSRAAQAGLLRHLRDRSTHLVRVIAFTGQGLRPLVSAGGFSSELAQQLEGLRLQLTPLRDRHQDIPALLMHLLQTLVEPGTTAPELATEFVEAATQYPWPGNFTQMEEAMRWLLERHRQGQATGGGAATLRSGDLMEAVETLAVQQGAAASGPRMVRLEQVLQEHIRAVLIGCNGNKLRAAEVLGISRSTLYRMLECTGYENDWPMAG